MKFVSSSLWFKIAESDRGVKTEFGSHKEKIFNPLRLKVVQLIQQNNRKQFSYISSIIFSLFSCFSLSLRFVSFLLLLKISFSWLLFYFSSASTTGKLFPETSLRGSIHDILCLSCFNHSSRAISRILFRSKTFL